MLTSLLRTTLSAAVVAAMLPAQQPRSLLFTTLGNEMTANPAFPPSLLVIDPEDVAQVTPNPGAPFTAEKFAPDMAWLTLAGDAEANGTHWEATFTDHIDALHARTPTDTNARDLYFSPSIALGAAVGPPVQPGDVVRMGQFGQAIHLLTEAQVRSAFNIPMAESINVDAFTIGQVPVPNGPYAGRILVFLSLESNHNGTFRNLAGAVVAGAAGDGAILAIPITAATEPVAGVIAGSGVLVATEAEVNALVVALGLATPAGNAVLTIGDLDGLELAPQGGAFATATGNYENLIFCGENLYGGGIASTIGGGSFAMINGVVMNPMAGGAGGQVGLQATNGSLNGLYLAKAEPWHIVTETPTPQIFFPPGGMLQIDVGGAIPGAPTFLLVGPAPQAAGSVLVMNPFANPGFPELIAPPLVVAALAIPANGTTSWAIGLAGGATPAVDLAFQVACWNGATWVLSAPLTIDLE